MIPKKLTEAFKDVCSNSRGKGAVVHAQESDGQIILSLAPSQSATPVNQSVKALYRSVVAIAVPHDAGRFTLGTRENGDSVLQYKILATDADAAIGRLNSYSRAFKLGRITTSIKAQIADAISKDVSTAEINTVLDAVASSFNGRPYIYHHPATRNPNARELGRGIHSYIMRIFGPDTPVLRVQEILAESKIIKTAEADEKPLQPHDWQLRTGVRSAMQKG